MTWKVLKHTQKIYSDVIIFDEIIKEADQEIEKENKL